MNFLKLAAQGNVIPVTRRLLADIETPLSAYRKIRGQGESFLFESVEGGEHLGRYSFVGCNPRAVIRQTGDRVEVIENGKVVETFAIGGTGFQPVVLGVTPETVGGRTTAPQLSVKQPPNSRDEAFGGTPTLDRRDACFTPMPQCSDGLEVVERVMKKYRAVAAAGPAAFHRRRRSGCIGYEFIHDVEPVVPRPPKDELRHAHPGFFWLPTSLLIFDRAAQTITVLVNAFLDKARRSRSEAYEDAVERN
jgi:anthranilate synthase component 1